MNGVLQAAVVVAFFLAANVVAAGVALVLGMVLLATPAASSPFAWLVVGIAAALAAYLFLKGAMFFAAERNPYKGLKSGTGRRGG